MKRERLEDPMNEMDQRLGSRYILRERLGRGAMGTVWRATNTDAKIDVAVKVLSEELSDETEMVARFIQERNALVAVRHPNLVRIHDLVVEDGRLAIIMDLIPGPDLHRHLAERGVLGLTEAAYIGRGVAGALEAIHSAGIIHRDLKPANILLDLSGPRPEPKLVDFGIARMLTGSRLTARSSVVGTPQYLSPEAISGAEPGPSVDVYAFGIALYELFTGTPPFHGDQLLQVLNQHMYQEPPWPTSIPPQILPLLQAMLAKNPQVRPTAAEIARQMDALIAGGPYPTPVPLPQQPAPAPLGPGTPMSPPPGQQSPYPPPSPYPAAAQPLAFPFGGPQQQTPLAGPGLQPGSTPIPAPSPSGFFYPNAGMLDPTYSTPTPTPNPSGGAVFTPNPPPFTDAMFVPKKSGGRKKILIAAGAVVGVGAVVGITFALMSGGKSNPQPIADASTTTASSPHTSTSPTVTPTCASESVTPSARWVLDGTTAACTSSSGSLHLAGGADWTDSRSKGTVLNLNGKSARATGSIGSIVNTAHGFTVSAWVYLNDEASTTRTIVGFEGNTADAFELQYDGTTKGWAFAGSGADRSGTQWVTAAQTKPATGHTWTHLVGVYNATNHTVTLYADGVLVANKSGINGWQAGGHITVGASLKASGSSYQNLDAEISQVQVFDSALNSTEVGAID
jgi:serine/threonine protein kinase